MRSLRRSIVIVVAVGLVDVVVLQATGNGNSGKHDSSGQILGFWIFVLSVLAVLSLPRPRFTGHVGEQRDHVIDV